MGNTNCLEGIKCPECGYEDQFNVQVTTWVQLRDDGTDANGDNEYDGDNLMECCDCGYNGRVKDFYIED